MNKDYNNSETNMFQLKTRLVACSTLLALCQFQSTATSCIRQLGSDRTRDTDYVACTYLCCEKNDSNANKTDNFSNGGAAVFKSLILQ